MTMTAHAKFDRNARIEYIKRTIGIGNIVQENTQPYRDTFQYICLTDTGVMIVLDRDHEKLVTMYVARLSQARRCYPDGYIPSMMFEVIKANTFVRENQPI